MSSKLKTILYGGTLQYPIKDPNIIIGDSNDYTPGTLVDANKVTQMINKSIQDLIGNSPDNLNSIYELAAKVNSVSDLVNKIKKRYWFQSSKDGQGIKIKTGLKSGSSTELVFSDFIRQWVNSNNCIETRIMSNGKTILKHINDDFDDDSYGQMYNYELLEGKIKANEDGLYLGASDAYGRGQFLIRDSQDLKEIAMEIGNTNDKNETGLQMFPNDITIYTYDRISNESEKYDKNLISLKDFGFLVRSNSFKIKLGNIDGFTVEGREGEGNILKFEPLGNVYINRHTVDGATLNSHNKRIIHYSISGGDEQNYNGHVLYYYGINGSNFISCTENKNKINIPQTTFEDKDAVNKEYVDSLFAQLNERINNLATN